jgi:hypothetical protein
MQDAFLMHFVEPSDWSKGEQPCATRKVKSLALQLQGWLILSTLETCDSKSRGLVSLSIQKNPRSTKTQAGKPSIPLLGRRFGVSF